MISRRDAFAFFSYAKWKDAPPEALMDSKLKCVFEPGAMDAAQAKVSLR